MCNFAVMKRELYIFNPENDMALGCGKDSYNAPRWALQWRHDLELLAAWIAPPGSMVLVTDAAQAQRWIDQHNLDVEAIDHNQLHGLRDIQVVPWGWSMPLCKELLRAGIHQSLLPSRKEMETVRLLAHRRTSIAMHQAMREELNREFSPIPVELNDVATVTQWALEHPGCYIKTPWSGSGRGVYRAIDAGTQQFERWCAGAITRQGSVLCEEALDRVMDFALEFHCDENGGCRFVGYSVFQSDEQSQYGGGVVAHAHELHDMIASLYPDVDVIVNATRSVVERLIAPHYHGYLGVDMLLYRNDNRIDIDPCIEVNLRSTMGLVTSILGERHAMKGTYTIAPVDKATGTQLTPIYNDTHHVAGVMG